MIKCKMLKLLGEIGEIITQQEVQWITFHCKYDSLKQKID